MTAYYNEYDKKAAAWLRELIADGLIAHGEVDERSITEVQPSDLVGYAQCHFFAGIGGWSYALRLANWPDDRPVWTGSCPCQPFSAAGKQKGQEDERHLWPHFMRLIRECRPGTVFGEQVASAIGFGWLDGVCADLEGEGYAVGATVLGAHSVGAPHIRQRLYWVADAPCRDGRRGERREETGTRQDEERGRGSASGSADGRLANADCPRRGEQRGTESMGAELQAAECRGLHGGLADADGRDEGDGELQRGGEHGQQQEDGSVNPWTTSILIPCRDGKTRRVPAEPDVQFVVDGLPGLMGPRWMRRVAQLKEGVIAHVRQTQASPREVLRAVWCDAYAQAIRGDAGGPDAVLGAKVLLLALCQLARDSHAEFNLSARDIAEIGQASMRVLWQEPPATCPSLERELAGPQSSESSDALHRLSLDVASEISARERGAVGFLGGTNLFPLTAGISPGRAGLLRGAGNAIVPQVAEAFVRAYLDANGK